MNVSHRLPRRLWSATTLLLLTPGLLLSASPVRKPAPAPAAQTTPATQTEARKTLAKGPTEAEKKALTELEAAVEARRIELGIPGVSLAIVKDDQVILARGFGFRDLEGQLPVTPETSFPIGSCTKAFTALEAMLAQEDGKLSLEDPPRKYLPYFKLADAEADAAITVRDLLSHRSGLNRTDLAMLTGQLSRQEVIQVAAQAKPMAPLRKKFLYQNVMYSAAGEVVGTAFGSSWEQVTRERILLPLGMSTATLDIAGLQKTKEFSYGYDYDADTKVTRRLPFRDIPHTAAAGAINANALEMARWVRFWLGGGVLEGKRLVSEKGLQELISPQITIAGDMSYGMGWMLGKWNGLKVVEHGGSIDGFNAQVAFIPEKNLGFVMLTNVSGSPLTRQINEMVWSRLAQEPAPVVSATEAPLEAEAGRYKLEAAGVVMEVVLKEGKLSLKVPGQPEYVLEKVEGRRYKLAAPAPAGFFATFRPTSGKPGAQELYLEQPHGNQVLVKLEGPVPTLSEPEKAVFRGLVGRWKAVGPATFVLELAEKEGKLVLVVPGQPDYAIEPKQGETYALAGLPSSFGLQLIRDGQGAVTGLRLKQPQGDMELSPLKADAGTIAVEALMKKVNKAEGGSKLKKTQNIRQAVRLDFVHQGVKARGVTVSRAPAARATSLTLEALGRDVGTLEEWFDGQAGGSKSSFSPPDTLTGKALDNAAVANAYSPHMDWKTLYKDVTVTGSAKVGEEDAWIVIFKPEKGNPVTEYISKSRYLVLKRETLSPTGNGDISLPVTEVFSDFRTVDGITLPFKAVQTTVSMGEVEVVVEKVDVNVGLAPEAFQGGLKP